ncbi:hypothetical protein JB92DRAFT_2747129 [Gautieria morchelliformis]|nr:hypothetical protein JB92DRAFT_2747129 [Gautieria morchelliformis]
MYLRLHIQSAALSPAPPTVPVFHFQGPPPTQLEPSKVSPLDAQHGAHAVALLTSLTTRPPSDDLSTSLQAAVSLSMAPDAPREVLYGSAGLLASLISANRLGASHPITSPETIRGLAIHIVEEGRRGAADYAAVNGSGLPLMWAWHGKYYLGAIHGVAGILTILLQLPAEIRDTMMDVILPAAYALLGQVDADGHLPSSLPRRYHMSGELVQICHGAPGALLLIAALRSACAHTGQTHPPELDGIESRLSDRVWEAGLLSKGISLCHGVAGNAWPWLLLSQIHKEPEKRLLDQYLRQALAFLLHATKLPPLGDMEGYGASDSSYSLFTGLAGAVTAWSEACTILYNRVGEAAPNASPETTGTEHIEVLGMPWLGGLGNCGI